jgi:hypothetical protein
MQNGLIWGDIATWVTGIATIALFIIGFLQIRNERKMRIKSEKELEFHNKRKQAEHISSWVIRESPLGSLLLAILNQSLQPVYQVIVTIMALGQEGEPKGYNLAGQVCIAVAPPGLGYIIVEADYHGMFRRPGVEIAFRDTAGRNWVRKANGGILEIEKSTLEYYGISLPANWRELTNDLPQAETLDQNNQES